MNQVFDKEVFTSPGRPKKYQAKMTKMNVTIGVKQVVWIDRLSASILEHSGNNVDRGAIIRSIIIGLENSHLDLAQCSTEEEITNLITNKLQSSLSTSID